MFEKEIDELSIADLQALVEEGIPEGRRLEFKSDHYGRKDEGRREFAADVSAMANAVGGYLVIGIAESNGIAADVCGVIEADSDKLVRSVTQVLRTSLEPPLPEFRVRLIPMAEECGVLVIKIARSWNAPHRVTVANDRRFFIRDENGKHQMSVDELRRAFLFASEVENRIRRFREERLELLTRNEGPLAVGKEDDTRLIMHVVPRVSFTDDIQLSLKEYNGSAWPWPLGASGANSMFSLDGLVSYSGPEEKFESVRAFSTLFRNGIAEAVAKIGVREKEGRKEVSLSSVEKYVVEGFRKIITEFNKRTVPAPYVILVRRLIPLFPVQSTSCRFVV